MGTVGEEREEEGERGQALFLQIAPTPIQPRPNSSTPSSSSSSSTTGPERLITINSLNTGHLSSNEQTRPTQNTHTIMKYNKTYVCKQCQEKFDDKHTLDRHLLVTHYTTHLSAK